MKANVGARKVRNSSAVDLPAFFGVVLHLAVTRSGHVAIMEVQILSVKGTGVNGYFRRFIIEEEDEKTGVSISFRGGRKCSF